MKQPEFTEGPWEISPHYYDEYDIVQYTIGPAGAGGAKFVEEMICIVESPNQPTEANARLIAAAPELYDSLVRMVEIETMCDHGLVNVDANGEAVDIKAVLENAISVLHRVQGIQPDKKEDEISGDWISPKYKLPAEDESVIVKSNGLVQTDTFKVVTRNEHYYWYRDEIDEQGILPLINFEKDQWMPLPK